MTPKVSAGTDVARKMIILGRECGLAVEMQQVKVQSLVPPQLADTASADDFMAQLPQVCLVQAVYTKLGKNQLQHTDFLVYCMSCLNHLLQSPSIYGCSFRRIARAVKGLAGFRMCVSLLNLISITSVLHNT